MRASHHEHEHHPLRVVDDLVFDERGRPAKWLWHLECRTCGQPLDTDLDSAGDQLDVEAFAAGVAA